MGTLAKHTHAFEAAASQRCHFEPVRDIQGFPVAHGGFGRIEPRSNLAENPQRPSLAALLAGATRRLKRAHRRFLRISRVSGEQIGFAIGEDVRGFAVSTAGEFGQALERIAGGTFVDRRVCDTIIDIMERQQYLDLLPRYLPYNPYARELKAPQALRIANKTGFFMGVRCDAALLFLPERTLVVVAFTRDSKDLTFNPDNENAIFLGRVGRVLYDHFA